MSAEDSFDPIPMYIDTGGEQGQPKRKASRVLLIFRWFKPMLAGPDSIAVTNKHLFFLGTVGNPS